MFHQKRIVGFQPFSDPGPTLPEKQRTSALVGNSRHTLHRSMSAFCELDCLLHFDPVKTVMAEKPAVFDLPDAIEKIVGNLVERDPSVLNVAVIALCDHCFDTANNHQ